MRRDRPPEEAATSTPDRLRRPPGVTATAVGIVALLLALAVATIAERRQEKHSVERKANLLVRGNADHGRRLALAYGCGGCHEMSRVPGAHGRVGPPLDGIGGRAYVGGVLENTPSNLVAWLRDPKSIDPKTAMPNVGLDEREARDVAAFLYTLSD